jgi:hypothetical protein
MSKKYLVYRHEKDSPWDYEPVGIYSADSPEEAKRQAGEECVVNDDQYFRVVEVSNVDGDDWDYAREVISREF